MGSRGAGSGKVQSVQGVKMPSQQAAGVKKIINNLENNKDMDITNIAVSKDNGGDVILSYDFSIDRGYTTNVRTGKKTKAAPTKGHTVSIIDKKGKVIAFNAQ